jgi:hypothetical protein
VFSTRAASMAVADSVFPASTGDCAGGPCTRRPCERPTSYSNSPPLATIAIRPWWQSAVPRGSAMTFAPAVHLAGVKLWLATPYTLTSPVNGRNSGVLRSHGKVTSSTPSNKQRKRPITTRRQRVEDAKYSLQSVLLFLPLIALGKKKRANQSID